MQKHSNDAEEARISKAIDDFHQNPLAWDEGKMGTESEIKQAVLSRILNDMGRKQSRMLVLRRITTVAASVIFVMGLLWLGFNYKDRLLDVVDPIATVVIRTKKNELKKILLSDGSVVWLNSNSTLSYPERFRSAKRMVDLSEGEAYFDIKHETQRPFQVKAGKTLTNVLGTAFNISAYSWLKKISVTVARGKVAVNNSVLLPNEQLLYTRSSGKLEQKKVSAGNVTSWMQGILSFNDDDFRTVAAKIEDKFNVKISFAQQTMEEFHFTGRFANTDQLLDVLDALTMTRGLNYQRKGNTILITN